jgi:hypothetical protein
MVSTTGLNRARLKEEGSPKRNNLADRLEDVDELFLQSDRAFSGI